MKFLYLVQGEASRIADYFHLADRPSCHAYFLSYDHRVDGCIYLPDSTWAEGRNRLLQECQGKDYDYIIFLDDDVIIETGSWSSFESALHNYQPAIGVPLVTKTLKSAVIEGGKPWVKQCFMINDEQFIAFHKDVIREGIVLPYVTQFDELSWWATCEIQQILIHTFYHRHALQFNTIKVDNLIHGRHDASDKSYKEVIRKWLQPQLKIPFTDIWYYWEDWPGAHVRFDLDIYLTDKTRHKLEYETNFKKIIGNTLLHDKFLASKNKKTYRLSLPYKKRVLEPDSRFFTDS